MRYVLAAVFIATAVVVFARLLPDAWSNLAETFTSDRVVKEGHFVNVRLFDYERRRGSVTDVTGVVDDDGVTLRTGWPRRILSSSLFVPWASIAACGQTLWCPGRDTNLWLDDRKVEISFEDDDRTILQMCDAHGVPVLTPKTYGNVKYGDTPLGEVRDIRTPQLFTLNCSESSFL